MYTMSTGILFIERSCQLSVCPAGTYSNVNGASSCTPCPANATCENRSFSCNSGFYQNGNSCLACYVNCKTCIGSGVMQCTSCIDSAAFISVGSTGMCRPCGNGCNKCTYDRFSDTTICNNRM